MKKVESNRLTFYYEIYTATLTDELMLHITIPDGEAVDIDLWLDKEDQKKLKDVLNEVDNYYSKEEK